MANSNPITFNWSDGYTDAYWSFEWSSEKYANGQTKVTWNLYARGRQSSPTKLWASYAFSIKQGNKTIVEETIVAKDDAYYFTGTLCGAGIFIVEHDTNGNADFTLTASGRIYEKAIKETTKDIRLTGNYPYTKCFWSSNAYIKLDRAYIGPGKTFNVIWGGANGGTANDITGYTIQCSVQGGEWEDVKVVSKDTNKCQFTLPADAIRGRYIYAKIWIKGSIKGYDSDPIQISTNVYMVNKAFNPPTINNYTGKATSNIISYNANEIVFEYTLPKKDTNQNIYIEFYKNGETTAITPKEHKDNKFVVSIDSGTTNSFSARAWDGEEPSALVNIGTIYSNTTELKDFVCFSWSKKFVIQSKVPDNKSTAAKKYGYYCYLYMSDNTGWNTGIAISNNKAFDFRQYYEKGFTSEKSYLFNFVLSVTDGVDEAVYTLRNYSFSVPKITVSGTKGGHETYFNNQIKYLVNNEKDYWQLNTSITANKGQVVNNYKANIGYGDFIVNANSMTRIKDFVVDFKVNSSVNKYKPYSEQLKLSAIHTGFNGNWKQYGLNSAPTLFVCFGNATAYEAKMSNGSTNDTIIYELSKENSYNIAKDFTSQNVVSKYLSYSYENVYGETPSSTASATIELDFREPARASSSNAPYWLYTKDKNVPDTTVNNWDCIKETMTLFTSFKVLSFSQPTAYLEISSNKTNWTIFGNEVKGAVDGTEETSELNTTPTVYRFDNSLIKVPEIQTEEYKYVRLVVTTNSSTKYYTQFKDQVLFKQHTNSKIEFTNIVYDASEGGFATSYRILIPGVNDINKIKSYKVKCYVKENQAFFETNAFNPQSTFFKYSDWNGRTYVYVAPILETTVGAKNKSDGNTYYVTTKQTPLGNYIYSVCYNISPTVAYRQNHIGINTNEIDSSRYHNSVAIVSQYQNRSIINFVGTKNEINLSAQLDLSTMGISGFIVDCGSWDGTSGGIIPGTGEYSGELAAIAYTGEIGDLEQKRKDIIYFSAGGSNEI